MVTVVPIFSECDHFIGLWARNRDFTPSAGALSELMSLAEPTLRALTKKTVAYTDNSGVASVGHNISFQDGVFLMIDGERTPTEEVKHGKFFSAISMAGIPVAVRLATGTLTNDR